MRLLPVILLSLAICGCSWPRGYSHIRTERTTADSRVVRITSNQGPFIEAVPNWNIASIDSNAPNLSWRARQTIGSEERWTNWSPLLSAANPGDGRFAKLDVDVITGAFDSVELKFDGGSAPIGRLSLTGTLMKRAAIITASRGTEVRIHVPHRSQKTDDESLAGRLCSPASLAMICAFYGESIDVATLARAAHDDLHDIYGNWPRNLQAVHQLTKGRLDARFMRMSSFQELRELLESGTPVVISVRGSLSGAPYSPTAGHLLVVCGMTADGDIITVDPAFKDATSANRIYSARDIAIAWLVNRRGSAYVVTRASTP